MTKACANSEMAKLQGLRTAWPEPARDCWNTFLSFFGLFDPKNEARETAGPLRVRFVSKDTKYGG
jgi:hypothetical protein